MAISLVTKTYNVIYIYQRDAHPGLLKIGKTQTSATSADNLTDNCSVLQAAAIKRLAEAATMGVTDLKLLHTEVAVLFDEWGNEKHFDDHEVHNVLLNSGYLRVPLDTVSGVGDEWFKVDLETAKKAIKAVKNGQEVIDGPIIEPVKYPEIKFREEQLAAINSTVDRFTDTLLDERKMLWNAKMRFGKTLCALEVINRLKDVKQVLILTHRPAVQSGWFEDYHLIKFQHEWQYGSKRGHKYAQLNDPQGHKDDYVTGKDLETMQSDLATKGTRYIYFASMQDLRGQEQCPEKDAEEIKKWKENNKRVYSTKWDLIIFDEAHEGTQTALGKKVAAGLTEKNKPLKLYLSGTPFNIMAQFREEEIFTWDYVMEQAAKENWAKNHPGEKNPYEGLAQLHIYTYSLNDVFANNPQYERKEEEDYFNFAEFFRVFKGNKEADGIEMPEGVQAGDFVHEKDVIAFLDLMCATEPVSQYPYSTPEFRDALSHTLWMLPGVAQAARLETLIKNHRLAKEFGYEVVNVAGEGSALETIDPDNIASIEKKEKDALKRVKKALQNPNSKTITLSCGRLTTGVSVPEWTGVFMLSGGYSTGAANYMQTIFRGQTPYKNGAIKQNCYAFDFAPDRTLTVVDDYIKAQPTSSNRKYKEGTEQTKSVEDFLRFCPVISMKGSEEVDYDALTFINQVNRAYTDHILQHGFKSRHLFKSMAKFTDEDHKLLEIVERLMGGSKVKLNSDGTIDVAKNNMTGENTKKPKKEPGENTKKPTTENPNTLSPKNNKKNEKREKEKKSQSVLDYIFVRLPLLLFGAVENADQLTVEELISDEVIDNESWAEFMPKGFTKDIFRQISHLIDVPNLISSTSKIVKEAKEADKLPIEQRIRTIADKVAKFHFPDKETVLTPWRVVNMHMSDTLGGYDFFDESHSIEIEKPRLVEQGNITSEVFCAPDTKVLEINSKSGVYPLWLAHTLWKLLGHEGMTQEEEWELWKRVLERNLYVVCKTRMAEKITRRVLVGYRKDIQVNTVSFENLIEMTKDEKQLKKLIAQIKNPLTYNNYEETNMLKFNAIVGNPPYQLNVTTENNTTNSAYSISIYNLFIELARVMNPQYISIISPSRWMTKGGQSIPDAWVDEMINSNHFRVIHDFPKATDCFPTVEIKGGISYFLYEGQYNGKCMFYSHSNDLITLSERFLDAEGFGIIVRDYIALDILKQIINIEDTYYKGNNFSDLVGTRDFFTKPKHLTSNWKGFVEKKDEQHPIKYYLNKKLVTSGYAWIKYEDIPKGHDSISLNKVFIPKAGGSGNDPLVVGRPFYGEPNSVSADTYMIIGYDPIKHNFSKEECHCIIRYIKTKIFRFLVAIKKKTQLNAKDVFQFVPLQDFSSKSDIDWSKSIAEIDQQLYKKYDLSDEQITYIESRINYMSSQTEE